ncbi:cell death activator CIDE-B isoform X6, partial [Biomphalaria pfeifferi]
NKLLTEREVIIIASSSVAGAALLILSLALTIYLICAKRKQLYRRSQRLQQKLKTWSMRDPLEEFVQRESVNQVTDVSYKPTALVRMSTRRESHLFKIWNQSRTIKKLVFAGSMMELIQAASERLKLPHPDKIVLEEDGTEVTSDEILLACAGSILLVLQPGEEWEPSLTLDVNQLPPTFNNLHRHSTISIIKSLQNIGAEMKTVRPEAGGAVVNEGYDSLSDEDKISQ